MFCPKCGGEVPYSSKICPICSHDFTGELPKQGEITPIDPIFKKYDTIAVTLGIGSVVLGTIVAILYGFIPAILGLILGIASLIFAIKVKNGTDGRIGAAGMALSIAGIVFATFFTIGCLSCACDCSGGKYTKWGTTGGACMLRQDVNDDIDEIEDAMDDIGKDVIDTIGNMSLDYSK